MWIFSRRLRRRMQQAALFRRERQVGVSVVLGFVCDCLRDLRETLGFRLCELLEYSCVFIFPQIAQITQRNAASCIISQRKTGCLRLRLFCCFGYCLRKSARSAGDFGVSIEYSYVFIFPQITQITQTNTAWLYYFAEKDRLGMVVRLLRL
jgi:hypothetical protein